MRIEQYIYLGAGESGNTLAVSESIIFSNGAYRIAFQALPGTLFTLAKADPAEYHYIDPKDPTVITMGPTGIYELGFITADIPQFMVLRTVDKDAPMILDVILPDTTDTSNSTMVENYLNSLLNEENYGGTNI